MALTIIKPSGGGLGLSSPGTAGNVLVSTGTGWASQEPAATGPKITNIQITNSSYTVLDDTAVSTSGGYIKITGSGFLAGAQVVIGTTNATSIAVVSSTVLNVQVPALSAGTYTVYVVNTDGSVGIRVNGLTYSGTPTWVTGSTLPQGQVNSAISIQLSATGDAPLTYALQAGSSLPSGVTLTSGGLLSGTVTGITVETTYNFTIEAIDAESQESPRAFSITITAQDQYFPYVSLLLSANTPTTSTFVKDASTNNFNITVNGDTRPNNFGPYTPGYYSNYFDGNGDWLSLATNSAFDMGTGDFTLEAWIRVNALSGSQTILASSNADITAGYTFYVTSTGYLGVETGSGGYQQLISTSNPLSAGVWAHVAFTKSSGTNRFFVNGSLCTNNGATFNQSYSTGGNALTIGRSNYGGGTNYITGYISNLRMLKGTALYTANFTPSTTPLTAIANTSLLTCQSNRFIDNSTNNFAVTVNGNTTINGFDPFVPASNTATYGSGYFDGTGDWLSTTCGAVGTGDFALECWVYPTVLGSFDGFVTSAMDGGGALGISISRDQAWIGNNSTIAVSYNWSANVVVNRWVHLAVTRQGTSVRFFVNGDLLSTGTASTNINSTTLAIGRRYPNWDSAYPTGYISNVRLVIGAAVYTASFTPSTSPLTAISGTSLLTLQTNQPTNNNMFVDNSTNNFLVTRNGNTTQGAFSPYPGTWSNYFDGTGDYLTIPNSSTLLFGSGNFTVETWVYPTAFAADRWIVGFWSYTAPANQSWGLYMNNSTGGYGFIIQGDAGAEDLLILSAPSSVVLNQWTHVAVTRSGSSWRMFINGVQSATGTYGGTLASPSSVLGIAAVENVPQLYIGYISNLRVVKGTAVYTSAFTTPTQPLLPITNTSLLICADNRLIDDSPNNFTVSRFGDVSVQKFSPFTVQTQIVPTSYSVSFDGSGDFLTLNNNTAFNFGSSDFTVEFWINTLQTTSNATLITKEWGSVPHTGGWGIQLNGPGSTAMTIYWADFSTSATFMVANTTSYRDGLWHHVAWVRNGSSFVLYIDGVSVATATNVTAFGNNSNQLTIGNDQTFGAGARAYLGLISNLRIVKGTAVYTANFTPSTTPLTAIANTSLLTCQSTTIIDNSSNAFTITVNGNSQPLAQNPFGYTNPATAAYTTTALGGSMYFDGTGDFLSVPNNSALDLGSGDYTIEGWWYFTDTSNQALISKYTANNGYVVQYQANNLRMVLGLGGSDAVYSFAWTAISNTWNHVAITRSGTSGRAFVNGTQIGSTTTFTTSNTVGATTLQIGSTHTVSELTRGYVSDVRIVKGQALYTSPFVPPIAPVTSVQNTVLLLNGTSGGIIDSSTVNDLETVADTRINNTIVKFSGTNSIYFDGTGDYLLTPASPANVLGPGNFTIEVWLYPSNITAGYRALISSENYSATTGGWSIYQNGASVEVWFSPGSSALLIATSQLTANTWVHIALVRSGSTVTLYVNGVSRATATSSASWTGQRVWIGDNNGTPDYFFIGYMSDLRITNGIARYTATFTPPTSPFIQY